MSPMPASTWPTSIGVLGLIRRLCREQGIGVLLVLHDLQLASRYDGKDDEAV
ncbi:MAG: hypothetical protein ACHBMF_09875 [Chromatiales bacterium]